MIELIGWKPSLNHRWTKALARMARMARMARKPKRLHQRPSRRMKGWKTVIATSLCVSFLLGKKNLKNKESWQIYNLVFISSCVRSRVRAGSIASASDTKPMEQQDQQAAKSRDHKILHPFTAERKGAGAASHFTQPWVNDDTWIYTHIYIYIYIYYIILYIILYYIILYIYYIILYYITLHYITLYYIILYVYMWWFGSLWTKLIFFITQQLYEARERELYVCR